MGDDLAVVNDTRVSFNKESDWNAVCHPANPEDPDSVAYRKLELKAADRRLLRFLAEHGHTSPLRHSILKFEIYAPLMVARQWGKYRVGSVWGFEPDDPMECLNESSRRYVSDELHFYIPSVWRTAPENKKQGSGEPLVPAAQHGPTEFLQASITHALSAYERALADGICVEQARLFLPAYAMYIRSRWTVSLEGVLHFIKQRVHHDAQWEIQQFAQAVAAVVERLFPETYAAFIVADCCNRLDEQLHAGE